MVSDANPTIRESREAVWRRCSSWLEQQYDTNARDFEAQWVWFSFRGEEARANARDLLVAWCEYSQRANAAGIGEFVGISARRDDSMFAGVLPGAVEQIEGTLDEFVARTGAGTEIRADRRHILVLAR
jgi:hypothetical protein